LKHAKGKLYPKAARTGPYAYAQEVARVNGRVVSKYLGIVKVDEKVVSNYIETVKLPESPPPPDTRDCKYCGTTFTPSWARQRYCCGDHATRWKIEHFRRSSEKMREDNRKHRESLRAEILVHYGGDPPRCACCGEGTKEFLAIDHINNNGYMQYRDPNWSGNLYQWLKKKGYPDGFQVLCHNCNSAKSFYHACPHKSKNHIIGGTTSQEPTEIVEGRDVVETRPPGIAAENRGKGDADNST
jgi:hypothetical protein